MGNLMPGVAAGAVAVGLMRSAASAEALGLAVLENSAAWLASDNLTTDESEMLTTYDLSAWPLIYIDTPTETTIDGRACWELKATASTSQYHMIRDITIANVKNGQACLFALKVHSGTEDIIVLEVQEGSNRSVVYVDGSDGSLSYQGANTEGIEVLCYDLGDGWYQIYWRVRFLSTSTKQMRIKIRQILQWAAAGTETIYVADPTLTILTTSQAVAPNGSTWTQAGGKIYQPIVLPGAGGVNGVGGLLAQSDVYLETSVVLSSSTLSLSWVGHPGIYRASGSPDHSTDMIVWRAYTSGGGPTGDRLEILLRNDGTRDRWAVRSTISGTPTTLTLTDRGASWATACVGVTISGGTLTWYVDGSEFSGGSLTIPSQLDTIRAGQMGGADTGWNAVVTDCAAWNSALSQTQHSYVAHALLQRAGIAWGPYTVVAMAGDSNAGTAGSDYQALSYRNPIDEVLSAYCRRAETSPGDSDPGSDLAAHHLGTVTATTNAVYSQLLSQNRDNWDVSYAVAADTTKKIVVIALSASGCTLAPGTYTWDPGSANVFTRMAAEYVLKEGFITGAIGTRVLLWVHGANDCGSPNAENYQSRLTAFIPDWETAIGNDLDKVIIPKLSDTQTALNPTGKATVIAAQVAVAAAVGGVAVDTDGADSSDGIHWNAIGKVKVGELVAAVL